MAKRLLYLIIVFIISLTICLFSEESSISSREDSLLSTTQADFDDYCLNDIFILDDTLWFVVGELNNEESEKSYGIFLKTIDGGKNWFAKEFPYESLHCVWFGDEKNGWIATVQEKSYIILFHTIDGGDIWMIMRFAVPYPTIIRDIIFSSDRKHGRIEGDHYFIITNDYGENWQLIF